VRILRQSRIRAVRRHGVKGARTQIRSCGAFVLVDETAEDVAAEQPGGIGRCAATGLRPLGCEVLRGIRGAGAYRRFGPRIPNPASVESVCTWTAQLRWRRRRNGLHASGFALNKS
jgi:hypothetical protein